MKNDFPPLDENSVKINVDGAISSRNRAFGMGAVARDHQGEVLAAMACRGKGAMEAEVAEACSVQKALQWAQNLAFRRIIIELDCASIVTVINGEIFNLNSSLGVILLDCKSMLASFASGRVTHVRRGGNAVAHELAKRALEAEDDEFWIEDASNFIAHLVT